MIRNKTNAVTTNDDDGDDGSGAMMMMGVHVYSRRVLDAQQIRRIFESNKKIEVKNASVDGLSVLYTHRHCHIYIHMYSCVCEYELACVCVLIRARVLVSLSVCVYARPYRHFKCALKPRDWVRKT